jgi:hypothetical protein
MRSIRWTPGIVASALAVAGAPGWSADLPPPRLYRVTTETGLPHLEESLRYATTRSEVCLGPRQLPVAFPLLQHDALAGCALGGQTRHGDSVSFTLRCAAGNETTGSATWRFSGGLVHGTLDVRLGGKNMTVYQRVSGREVGECGPRVD